MRFFIEDRVDTGKPVPPQEIGGICSGVESVIHRDSAKISAFRTGTDACAAVLITRSVAARPNSCHRD
jgi:hypothetical protein